MNNQNLTSPKEPFGLVIIIAFLIAFLGIAVLSWQYNRMTDQEISSLKETIERNWAENILEKFMQYRIEKNESQAITYLTENAIEQKNQGNFLLINNFKSFKILGSQKINELTYKFTVEIEESNENNKFIEMITLIKIKELDKYYVNSIEMAG